MTNYEKLQKVLTELFQLDKAELDFGIYRIMNQKRDDVLDFLSNKLPKEVRTILENQQRGDTVTLKKQLDEAIKTAKEFGLNPDTTPKVQEARALYEGAGSVDSLEQEVFSHLASFFKRYYQGGDFISLRRYKKDVYAIPYEGEEVKLHWANHDQYYIKTSENLKNYAFKVGEGKTIRFTLKEASTEQNNNKAQKDQERRFAIYTEEPVTVDSDTLHINFTYEPHKKTVKQDKLLQKAIDLLTSKIPVAFAEIFSLAPTEKNKTRTLLEKHLNDFSARNTFDYFIHKDLGGFLTRELDFYIKNEVLFIDDINTESEQAFTAQLSKIRAIKQVANKIITFLAQLENFQKKLWLKKKFIVSCDYCITLDRVPQTYYKKIVENNEQIKEWETLFNVKIKNEEDLKNDPFLVLDTKFFSEEFKDKLMSEFDNLDEQTNGLMINSDNFQALNFIQNSKRNGISALYIDPPYNTNASEIIYKNGYKSSSWLGLMENRLKMSYPLLNDNSITCATIDDLEFRNLNWLMHQIYGSQNHQATVIIRNNPSGRATVKGFAINHEYGLFYSKDSEIVTLGRLPHTEKQTGRYEEQDENGDYFEWENFRKNGTDSDRPNRPKQFFPFFFDRLNEKLRIPKVEFKEESKIWSILEKPLANEIIIYPIDENGSEKVWKYGEERTRKSVDDLLVKEDSGTYRIYRRKFLNNEGSLPRTWWEDSKYSARDRGTRDIRNLFGKSTAFDFPKSVYAVCDSIRISLKHETGYILDYFAGSATTGHATIKLNREDNGNRKYILVEMGEYFNTVTKPRIQKVIYTDNWKNGKPQDKKGLSQVFKYFNLESYEDTLNNLQLLKTKSQQKLLASSDSLQEEYLVQYMLDVETREHLMNVEAFKNPFDYKLNITENNQLVPTNIDLVETFNYLIGLNVKRIQRTGAFKTVEGIINNGEKILVIWRNLQESNNSDLDKFVIKMDYNLRDGEFDMIYVNGDNNLANLKREEDTWKVLLLEEVFFTAMFDVKDI